MMKMETRQFELCVAERQIFDENNDAQVGITGWAVRYGQPYKLWRNVYEVIKRGAFSESIADMKAQNRKMKMFWNHYKDSVIGTWDTLTSKRDGLEVAGSVPYGVTDRGDDAGRQLERGLVDSLSVGFRVVDEEFVEGNDGEITRTIKKGELLEVSVVTLGASPTALITEVRNAWGLDEDIDMMDEINRRARIGTSDPEIYGTGLEDPYEVLGRFCNGS